MTEPLGVTYGYMDQHGVVRPMHQVDDWPPAERLWLQRWAAPVYPDGSHGPWQRPPRMG